MSARNMAKRTAAGTLALAVCLGGGAIALASAASADANFKFDTRIAGDDRYQTAIAASKAAFPTDGKTDNVILVNGYATVDGLTASYLAGVANAPILYVSDQGADAATKAEIKRLGAKNIWLVGGTTVIPTSVETAIKGDGYTVSRISGEDRYETAAAIAEAGMKMSGKKPSKVFVASGTSFADALAVSPVAYGKGYPIILTDKDKTSDASKKELGIIGTDTKILVGGTAVVSDSVAKDLTVSTRVAGDDRAVTANLVSDWAKKSEGFNPANAILVGGTNGNGADSLVASALGAKSFSTLHFAGWDATATYFKDHSSELTGKGFVFGGKAAVSEGQVSAAQSAAQTVAVASTYVVTSVANATSGKFTYADAKAGKGVEATFASTDKFSIDGQSASSGAFAVALTVGDVVSWTKSGDVTTFTLVNKNRDVDYTSGVVGNFDLTNKTFDIIEPVTGTPLNATPIGYGADFTFFTIDGQAATAAQFLLDINEGDSIAVSGGDGSTSAKARTIALTNRTVSGSISAAITTAGQFGIKTEAGAVLGDDLASHAYFALAASGDVVTYNGTSIVKADFIAAKGITAGDAVTYSRKGGVQTVSVKDAAPAPVSGIVASGSSVAALSIWTAGATSAAAGVDYSTGYVLTVDGALVSPTEFTAALSAGDEVVVQEAGGTVKASVSLTSKPLSGKVSAVSGDNLTVRNSDDTATFATVNTASDVSVYSGNTSSKYYVNGTEQTLAQFRSEASFVANGTKTATLTVTDNGTVSEYRLASVVNTASAKLQATSTGFAGAANTTTVTIKFDKPVYLSAAAADGDFTFTGAGLSSVHYTAASPSVAANASNTVVLTIPSTTTSTGTLTVALTTSGAAKFLDASGKAATASSTTIAVS